MSERDRLSRRGLLVGLGALASAGCLGRTGASGDESTTDGDGPSPDPGSPDGTTGQTTTTSPATPSGECAAVAPPAPSTAATDPKPYPSKPGELTRRTAVSFAEAYERAYQYNDQLAEHPDKLGRTNDVDLSIYETAVESTANGYRVTLSGQLNWSVIDRDITPETPTQTPLPQGHRGFETTYLVTDRFVRRNGVVVECW